MAGKRAARPRPLSPSGSPASAPRPATGSRGRQRRLQHPAPTPSTPAGSSSAGPATPATARAPGSRRSRPVPREHWTWAADSNAHPALVSMELWEAAQATGRKRGNVQDHQDQRQQRPRLTTRCARGSAAPSASGGCAATGQPRARPRARSSTTTSAPTTRTAPATGASCPDHIRAAVRERGIHPAVDQHHHRAAGPTTGPRYSPHPRPPPKPSTTSRATSPAPSTCASNSTRTRPPSSGLITQLERLGDDTSPAADAMRQRITDQFTQRYNQAREPPSRARPLSRPPSPTSRTTQPHSTNCPTPPPPSPTRLTSFGASSTQPSEVPRGFRTVRPLRWIIWKG